MLVNTRAGPYRASHDHTRDEVTVASGPGFFPPPRRWSRGAALSSAILYLAIVAIWAIVLVPRWLHPPQPAPRTAGHDDASDTSTRDTASTSDDAPYEEPSPAEDSAGDAPTGSPQPVGDAPGDPSPTAGPDPRHAAAAARRARILRARRRTLGMLVLLLAGAVALAAVRLAAWWVVLPPAAMLAGLLILLRTAARLDTERITARTEAATHDGRDGAEAGSVPTTGQAERAMAEPAEYAAVAPASPGPVRRAAPEPSAEVIDLSARMEEQPYDQYLDAEARAVGD